MKEAIERHIKSLYEAPATRNRSRTAGNNVVISNVKTVPEILPSESNNACFSDTIARAEEKAAGTKGRIWQPWSEDIVALFYEGVKLYGKDFEKIRKFMSRKSKVHLKTYDQVRNFYYNSWFKLSARVDLTDIDASKEAKELFLLISYGELMKKTNSTKIPSKHLCRILDEIVRNGSTVVKMKIRTVNRNKRQVGKQKFVKLRIKIPQCDALLKFHHAARLSANGNSEMESQSQDCLPESVLFELVPKSHTDRLHVLHKCEQNPQIRFKLTLQQCFKEVIGWLRNKWVPPALKQIGSLPEQSIEGQLPKVTLYAADGMKLTVVKLATRPTALSHAILPLGLAHCFKLKSSRDPTSLKEPADGSCATEEKAESSKCQNAGTEACLPGASVNVTDATPSSKSDADVQNSPHSVTLDPQVLIDGLDASNCDLTAAHICLMCSGAASVRLLYSIEPKLNETTVTPAWVSLLRLVKNGFSGLLEKELPTAKSASSSAKERCGGGGPFAVPSHRSAPKILPVAVTCNESQIVKAENNAFLTQYSQIVQECVQKKRPVIVTKRPTQTYRQRNMVFLPQSDAPAAAVSSSSSATDAVFRTPPVMKQNVFTRFIGGGAPAPADASPQIVFIDNPATEARPSDLNDVAPHDSIFMQAGPSSVLLDTSLSMLHPPQSPMVDEFSMNSNHSIFDYLSTPGKKDGDRLFTNFNPLKNVMDFSMDSSSTRSMAAHSLNVSNDAALQRDVKKSLELMINQDSSEYCKHFADLAGNLETPKKIDFGPAH